MSPFPLLILFFKRFSCSIYVGERRGGGGGGGDLPFLLLNLKNEVMTFQNSAKTEKDQ